MVLISNSLLLIKVPLDALISQSEDLQVTHVAGAFVRRRRALQKESLGKSIKKEETNLQQNYPAIQRL